MSAPTTPGISARILAMWALAASTFLYAFLQRVSPSVMVEDLMRGFGVGGALLGNLSAFYLYAYAVLQLPLGVLFDRFGVRRLMGASFVLAGIGSLLFAVADTLLLAYLGRLLIGAGVACSFVGALTVAAQWLPASRFGFFAGLVQLLGMVGAIFGQAPLAALVDRLGWRGALAALGAVGIVLAIGLYAMLRDKPAAAGPRPRLGQSLRAVIGLRDTWSCAIYGFAMTGPMLAFAGLWAVPFLATAYDFPRTTAAGLTSLIFAGWGVGAPTLGWLSDHLGRRRAPMLLCSVVSGVILSAIIFGPVWPIWLIAVLLIGYGFFASAMVLSFALVKESNAPEASAAAMGVVNTFVVGSGALLQPFIGWLLDLHWGGASVSGARIYEPATYVTALTILPVLVVIAFLAGLTMRERPKRLVA